MLPPSLHLVNKVSIVAYIQKKDVFNNNNKKKATTVTRELLPFHSLSTCLTLFPFSVAEVSIAKQYHFLKKVFNLYIYLFESHSVRDR